MRTVDQHDRYTSFMRRWLIVLFLVVLPLQFAWGAAARYCAHEAGDGVSHFGHHAHVHKASIAHSDSTESPAGSDDPDCDYCHLGCAQPLASRAMALIPASAPSFHVVEATPPRFRIPDPLERPNWLLAV